VIQSIDTTNSISCDSDEVGKVVLAVLMLFDVGMPLVLVVKMVYGC